MDVNVAMYKYARQSRNHALRPAGLAVDGRRVFSPTSRSRTNCAVARNDGNSTWWMVDLGSAYEISTVSILTYGQCAAYPMPVVLIWPSWSAGPPQKQ